MVAPGASGVGYTRRGPLEHLSAHMTRMFLCLPTSTEFTAVAMVFAPVAHAWLIMGPVACSAPIMDASHGVP